MSAVSFISNRSGAHLAKQLLAQLRGCKDSAPSLSARHPRRCQPASPCDSTPRSPRRRCGVRAQGDTRGSTRIAGLKFLFALFACTWSARGRSCRARDRNHPPGLFDSCHSSMASLALRGLRSRGVQCGVPVPSRRTSREGNGHAFSEATASFQMISWNKVENGRCRFWALDSVEHTHYD